MTAAPSDVIRIRPRPPGDDGAIARVVTAAFGGPNEAALIDALRRDDAMLSELVAWSNEGDVVGHLAFSRLDVRCDFRTLPAAALAPLAVSPGHQRQGIGDRLTREGLAALTQQDIDLVVVLGHPAYYRRFGFSSLLAKLLAAPYSGEAFMALELRPGCLASLKWTVTYPRAFAAT